MDNKLDCFKFNKNHQDFPINFKINKLISKDYYLPIKIGTGGVLIWNNDGTSANIVITSETPIQICNDFKNMILKEHNNGRSIISYFNVGTYYFIVKTPYICRLQIIDMSLQNFLEKVRESDESKEKEFIIKKINKKYYKYTQIIEASIYIIENNNNIEFAKKVSNILMKSFYNEQLMLLKNVLINDLIYMVDNFL